MAGSLGNLALVGARGFVDHAIRALARDGERLAASTNVALQLALGLGCAEVHWYRGGKDSS